MNEKRRERYTRGREKIKVKKDFHSSSTCLHSLASLKPLYWSSISMLLPGIQDYPPKCDLLFCRMFGPSPVNMQCPNCRAQVTTGRLQCSMNIVHGNKKPECHQIVICWKILKTLSLYSNCWRHWSFCLDCSWSDVCCWWVRSSLDSIIAQLPCV